ncbi:type VI secretion system-associated protein TagF (plasmid) [Pseudoalteromonas espejiana]
MSDPIINIGYLGKVPSLGDFVQDSVSKSFSKSTGSNGCKQPARRKQMGVGKIFCSTGPVWHFALSPNIVGNKGVMGTLPSMDAVGRHYPFTVAEYTSKLHQ